MSNIDINKISCELVCIMKIKITCHTAENFFSRLLGLIKKEKRKRALFFPKCRSIHTFFMKNPITLVWVDQFFNVIDIHEKVIPRNLKFCQNAYGVFEFPNNNFPKKIKIGDQINPRKK